jgi:hypothetical protein
LGVELIALDQEFILPGNVVGLADITHLEEARLPARSGLTPDPRAAEAIDLVRSKRDAEGRLPLENPHESELVNARVRDLAVDMGEREGRRSRWNTLRALRVLDWYGRASPH